MRGLVVLVVQVHLNKARKLWKFLDSSMNTVPYVRVSLPALFTESLNLSAYLHMQDGRYIRIKSFCSPHVSYMIIEISR